MKAKHPLIAILKDSDLRPLMKILLDEKGYEGHFHITVNSLRYMELTNGKRPCMVNTGHYGIIPGEESDLLNITMRHISVRVTHKTVGCAIVDGRERLNTRWNGDVTYIL